MGDIYGDRPGNDKNGLTILPLQTHRQRTKRLYLYLPFLNRFPTVASNASASEYVNYTSETDVGSSIINLDTNSSSEDSIDSNLNITLFKSINLDSLKKPISIIDNKAPVKPFIPLDGTWYSRRSFAQQLIPISSKKSEERKIEDIYLTIKRYIYLITNLYSEIKYNIDTLSLETRVENHSIAIPSFTLNILEERYIDYFNDSNTGVIIDNSDFIDRFIVENLQVIGTEKSPIKSDNKLYPLLIMLRYYWIGLKEYLKNSKINQSQYYEKFIDYINNITIDSKLYDINQQFIDIDAKYIIGLIDHPIFNLLNGIDIGNNTYPSNNPTVYNNIINYAFSQAQVIENSLKPDISQDKLDKFTDSATKVDKPEVFINANKELYVNPKLTQAVLQNVRISGYNKPPVPKFRLLLLTIDQAITSNSSIGPNSIIPKRANETGSITITGSNDKEYDITYEIVNIYDFMKQYKTESLNNLYQEFTEDLNVVADYLTKKDKEKDQIFRNDYKNYNGFGKYIPFSNYYSDGAVVDDSEMLRWLDFFRYNDFILNWTRTLIRWPEPDPDSGLLQLQSSYRDIVADYTEIPLFAKLNSIDQNTYNIIVDLINSITGGVEDIDIDKVHAIRSEEDAGTLILDLNESLGSKYELRLSIYKGELYKLKQEVDYKILGSVLHTSIYVLLNAIDAKHKSPPKTETTKVGDLTFEGYRVTINHNNTNYTGIGILQIDGFEYDSDSRIIGKRLNDPAFSVKNDNIKPINDSRVRSTEFGYFTTVYDFFNDFEAPNTNIKEPLRHDYSIENALAQAADIVEDPKLYSDNLLKIDGTNIIFAYPRKDKPIPSSFTDLSITDDEFVEVVTLPISVLTNFGDMGHPTGTNEMLIDNITKVKKYFMVTLSCIVLHYYGVLSTFDEQYVSKFSEIGFPIITHKIKNDIPKIESSFRKSFPNFYGLYPKIKDNTFNILDYISNTVDMFNNTYTTVLNPELNRKFLKYIRVPLFGKTQLYSINDNPLKDPLLYYEFNINKSRSLNKRIFQRSEPIIFEEIEDQVNAKLNIMFSNLSSDDTYLSDLLLENKDLLIKFYNQTRTNLSTIFPNLDLSTATVSEIRKQMEELKSDLIVDLKSTIESLDGIKIPVSFSLTTKEIQS